MSRFPARLLAVVASAGALAGGSVALAHEGKDDHRHGGNSSFKAFLNGYQEVPAVSTTASGTFKARLDGSVVRWRLSYRDIEGGAVQQAHVHFGQPAVNGGVSVFLCSNLAGAPAGVQRCPASPARITGTIEADDVVGPRDQGIDPGELDELLAAMQAGVTYANVHTDRFPNGEIRGQILPKGKKHHDDRHDHD